MGAKNAKNPNPHDCGILLPMADSKCAAVRKANEKNERLKKEKDDKKRAKYDPKKESKKRRNLYDKYWYDPETFSGVD